MDRCERHETVLEAVRVVRAELRDHVKAHPESTGKTFEIFHRLVSLYACLEVEALQSILTEFKALDRRTDHKVPRYKDAA